MRFQKGYFKRAECVAYFGGCLDVLRAGIDEERRRVPFTLTDEVQDRARISAKGKPAGDIIRIDGLDMRDYLKNPVLMWGHDYAEPPVGRIDPGSIVRRGSKLVGIAEYPSDEESGGYERARIAWGLTRSGYLKAYSIAFRPVKAKEMKIDSDDDGYGYRPVDFEKSYLIEVSNVPIPMNQNALVGRHVEEDFSEMLADVVGGSDERPDKIQAIAFALAEALNRQIESDLPAVDDGNETGAETKQCEKAEGTPEADDREREDDGHGSVVIPTPPIRLAQRDIDELAALATSRVIAHLHG